MGFKKKTFQYIGPRKYILEIQNKLLSLKIYCKMSLNQESILRGKILVSYSKDHIGTILEQLTDKKNVFSVLVETILIFHGLYLERFGYTPEQYC